MKAGKKDKSTESEMDFNVDPRLREITVLPCLAVA